MTELFLITTSKRNLLFTWSCVCEVVLLNPLSRLWLPSTTVKRWFAVNVMLVFLLVLPTAVRRSVDTPINSVPRRSWNRRLIVKLKLHFSQWTSGVFFLFLFITFQRLNWSIVDPWAKFFYLSEVTWFYKCQLIHVSVSLCRKAQSKSRGDKGLRFI